MRKSTAVALALTALLLGPAAAGDAPPHQRLLVHYMPWYETPDVRGAWGYHWTGPGKRHDPSQTGPGGLPDLYSHFHPLIGPYDSTDPHVLECQLLQMKLAGIDGVVADWYGISDAADYPPIHAATKALFAATKKLGMEFAVCFEDRTFTQQELAPEAAAAQLAETYRWLDQNWFPAPHYARVDDRPLLLNFGPLHLRDRAPWGAAAENLTHPPSLFCLHHLWKPAGAHGGFAWVHAEPWTGPDTVPRTHLRDIFDGIASTPGQAIPSAFPGYRDIYDKPLLHLDHRGGQVLRDSLAVALAGSWPVVQLVTWNDYGEGTMVEPTHEFGYTFLEIVQAARETPHTAADLRLPARLLTLRRTGQKPAADLDEIAADLAAGDTTGARRRLDPLAATE